MYYIYICSSYCGSIYDFAVRVDSEDQETADRKLNKHILKHGLSIENKQFLYILYADEEVFEDDYYGFGRFTVIE